MTISKIKASNQFIEEIREFDSKDQLIAWRRFLTGIFFNPSCRKFTGMVFSDLESLLKFMDYLGYGIYVGRK